MFGLCLRKVRGKNLSYKARQEQVVGCYPKDSMFLSYGSLDCE